MTNEPTTTAPAADPAAAAADPAAPATDPAAAAADPAAPATDPAAAVAGPAAPNAAIAAPAAAGTAGRARWLIAGGAVVVSLAIIAGAVFLLGGRPVPEALTYIPADSAVVAELRLDLPGDQLQKVGNLLAHFPGFKDQSTLPQKLDEALTRLTTRATNGSVDYDSQLKPWIAGPTFAAGSLSTIRAMDLPTGLPSLAPAASGDGSGIARPGNGLIVATTDGTAKCESVIPAAQSPTTSTYQGVTLLTSADGTRACALSGRIGVLGTPALVRAALDAHAAHNGVDTTTAYRTARDTLGGDRLATVFVSKAGFASATSRGLPGGLASEIPVASLDLHAALAAIPDWMIAGVRAEDDALVADLFTAPVSAPTPSGAEGSPLPTLPPARASRAATLLPANTAVLVDVHGAGVAVRNALARLRDDPTVGAGLGQIDTTLAAFGGTDNLVGWVDDAAIAVVPDGTGASGGLMLVAPDDATAAAKVSQLKSLMALAALGGGQVQTHDETVGGVTMTVVDLGDLSTLLQGAGGGTTTLPIPNGTHLTIAFAAKGSAILAGGDAFVREALNVQAGGSLADAAPYKHAIGHAAVENLGEVYVGTGSVLALADSLLPEAERASFDTDTKPYLAPFDAMLVTSTLEHGGAHVRLVATVQ